MSSSTQTSSSIHVNPNKRSLEEIRGAGVDQIVKGLSDTGITRESLYPQFSTTDFLKKSLYGNSHASRLQNVHTIFAAGLERRRRAAQLGYGEDTPQQEGAEPPVKRRRFQRRNSKTPAMLFKSMNFLPQDLFEEKTPTVAPAPVVVGKKKTDDDDEDWDGGLEIAEQLVAHLQKRRLSDVSAH